MKNKSLFAALILAVVAFGCSQKDTLDMSVEDGYRVEILRAILPEDAPLTKMTKENPEAQREWDMYDDIAVHINNNGKAEYRICMSLGGGNFAISMPNGAVRDNYAIYPAIWADEENYSNPLMVSVPDYHEYDLIKDNQFMVGMIARNSATNNSLTFNYICGSLRLTVTDVPSDASKLSVLFDKRITGSFQVNSLARNPNISTDANTANALTIDFLIPDPAKPDSYTINIPMPLGQYTTIDVKALDDNGKEVASGNATFTASTKFTGTVDKGNLYEFTLALQNASPISTVTTTPMDVETINIQDGNHNTTWN